ncbi:PAS domain-containing sensor histidine kinase [Pseudomonas sp. BN515]|uniref:PAS domain-containing sensor histidine kinase n=1 Tax=Pseudomonas sp. BN515 TaxID=2567892 RepID=UPI002458612C|nr:PAS domain-containing sensor histidine kinase [Pseudomonas sp. BN515]
MRFGMGGATEALESSSQALLQAARTTTSSLLLALDPQGRVLGIAGALGVRLGRSANGQALPLADFVSVNCAALLSGTPEQWARDCFDLDFIGSDGRLLHTRGWLTATRDGWLLQAMDIGDLIRHQEAGDLRRQALLHAGQAAERIRLASASLLPQVTTELLEALALRWRVPCMALAIYMPGGQGWQIYAQHRGHGAPGYWQEGQRLGQELADLHGRAPQRWSWSQLSQHPRLFALLGDGPAFLVPYVELSGITAWLFCAPFEPDAHSALGDAEWQQVCAQLAGPLLARLRDQSQRHEGGRLEALQGMLGAGWWEYLPATREVLLAPALARAWQADDQGRLPLDGWLQQVHPADRDEFRARLRAAELNGQGFTQCLRLYLSSTQEAAIWHRVQTQVQGAGTQSRVFGFLLDISDIKAQEASAAAAHARLRNLIASAPAVIYVLRYEDGALLPEFCSESLGPMLGWTLAELQQGGLAERVHPEDHDIFFARTRSLLRDGQVSCRYRLRDRQGDYHWLLDEVRLLRNELGQPQEALGIWLDVTEATLAAERVRESEERYRILVEDSPAMICRYTPDLVLRFANRPLADYLECRPEELAGANLGAWLSEEQRQVFQERLISLTPEQPVSTAEICLQLPGREHAWWIWADRGVFDEHGRLLEVQAVGRDNTEVRKAQQQLYQGAKMATLGEMATGLAHEMNQPLNVMRMAVANVLKRVASDEVQVDYLRDKLLRIEAQVQRAARIVDHMRVFGRRSDVEQQLFDPREAVEGALSLLSEGLRGKGVDVRLALGEQRFAVRGFADQLEQVLINLMVNARDAMLGKKEKEPDFAPSILVGLESRGAWVELRVEDNGGGIDPRLLEKIFEPFFTTKPVGKGTGLGLSVSYGIVQQMGGRLSAENGAEGACFRIALPLFAESPGPVPGQETAASELAGQHG